MIREDKPFNEGLMLGKTRTATGFSKEQDWNRESTQNQGTEDTSGKDTPQRGILRNKTKTGSSEAHVGKTQYTNESVTTTAEGGKHKTS